MTQRRSPVPLTDLMFNKASRRKIPLSGTFELTPMCNFSCRMCYVRKTASEVKASSRPMMTFEQWMKIARNAFDAGMLHLLLTGGEPTSWPDFWKLYENLVYMGLLVSINTNGSMLDDESVERLKALPPRRINITLYGSSNETYERLCGVKNVFEKVDRAIGRLKDAGIQIKLNCSLTPYNVGDLETMIAYAQKRELILDVASYMFPPIRRNAAMTGKNDRFTPKEAAFYRLKTFHLQNGDERYKEFLENILNGSVPPPGLDENCLDPVDGQIRCRAGRACFWITWDGWMEPCGVMSSPKIDVTKQEFEEAWKRLTEVSGKIRLSGVCGKCPNLELCHSCAAMAQTETGSVSGIPVYLCESIQEMKKLAEKELSTIC